MTLPQVNPFSWFLGTPEDRSGGGLMALLWQDTILPYSVSSLSIPGWWDQPGTDHGQFEGWFRNFGVSEIGAPNFPNDREAEPVRNRFFNCVVPFMLGLKQSASAPRRMRSYLNKPNRNASDGPSAEEEWPFRGEDEHALHFLELYMENFIDPETTSMIVALPVRDVMNYIANPNDDTLYPAPSAEAGEAALEIYVKGALTKAKELGIRILGWYLIDEPDFLLFNYWVSVEGMAKLRVLVRRLEHEWRMALVGALPNDPAYRDLLPGAPTDFEREARLRPCITTFSSDFGNAFPADNPPPNRTGRESPTLYAEKRAADLYMFDWYPYRRTRSDVEADWTTPCGSPQNFGWVPSFTFSDRIDRIPPKLPSLPMTPKVSLRRFQDLHRLLNTTGLPEYPVRTFGDPERVPVLAWSQAAGASPASRYRGH